MAAKVPDTLYWQESWGFLKEQSAKDEAKRQKVSRFSGIVMQRDAIMGNGHNCTKTWNSCGCCPEGCAAKIVRHAYARVAASSVADIGAAEVFEIPSLLRKGYGSVSGAPAVSKDFCLALLVVPTVASCCKKFACAGQCSRSSGQHPSFVPSHSPSELPSEFLDGVDGCCVKFCVARPARQHRSRLTSSDHRLKSKSPVAASCHGVWLVIVVSPSQGCT